MPLRKRDAHSGLFSGIVNYTKYIMCQRGTVYMPPRPSSNIAKVGKVLLKEKGYVAHINAAIKLER